MDKPARYRAALQAYKPFLRLRATPADTGELKLLAFDAVTMVTTYNDEWLCVFAKYGHGFVRATLAEWEHAHGR